MIIVTNVLEVISNTLIPVALLALLAFIYLYAKYSPWRLTLEGRTLMYQYASWAAYLIFVIASVYFPDFPGRDWVRTIIYIFITISFWTMTINLYKAQKSHNTKKAKEKQNV